MSHTIMMHSAGKNLDLNYDTEPFLAAIEVEKWTEADIQEHKDMVKTGEWDAKFGDRRTELVLIGVQSNKEIMLNLLNAALISETEEKMMGGVEGFRTLPDPFFGGKCAELFFDPKPPEPGTC